MWSLSKVPVSGILGWQSGMLERSVAGMLERSVAVSVWLDVSCCALGRMLLNDSKKGPAHLHYRRPYGCAVLSILDVLQSLTELKEEKDFVLKVYTWVWTSEILLICSMRHCSCPHKQQLSSFVGHRIIRICRIGSFVFKCRDFDLNFGMELRQLCF